MFPYSLASHRVLCCPIPFNWIHAICDTHSVTHGVYWYEWEWQWCDTKHIVLTSRIRPTHTHTPYSSFRLIAIVCRTPICTCNVFGAHLSIYRSQYVWRWTEKSIFRPLINCSVAHFRCKLSCGMTEYTDECKMDSDLTQTHFLVLFCLTFIWMITICRMHAFVVGTRSTGQSEESRRMVAIGWGNQLWWSTDK